MGLNISTNLPMFVYTLQAMWRHRPLEEYLVFVGIHAAHTSFSPFTLGSNKPLSTPTNRKEQDGKPNTKIQPNQPIIWQQLVSSWNSN